MGNMVIQFSSAFTKAYRKLPKEQQESADRALRLFAEHPFDPTLRNHKLTGSQKGVRSISAGYDLRLLYVERDGHALILFIKIGSHEVVY